MLGGSVAFGAKTLLDEWSIFRFRQVATESRFPQSPATRTEMAQNIAQCDASANDRTLYSCITLALNLSLQETTIAARAPLIAAAQGSARALVARYPQSGKAQAALAVTAAAAREDASALAALSQSYARAPYLRDAAAWRLWYGSHHWEALSYPTRRALLQEALWMGRLGRPDRQRVLEMLAGTRPYITVSLRLPGKPGQYLPVPERPE